MSKMADWLRVVEFGEYLAVAAERYQDAVNAVATDDELADDRNGDTYRNLSSAIYEFRKRAKRLAARPANENDDIGERPFG